MVTQGFQNRIQHQRPHRPARTRQKGGISLRRTRYRADFPREQKGAESFHSFTNHTGITEYNLSCKFGDVAVPEMTLFVLNFALQI